MITAPTEQKNTAGIWVVCERTLQVLFARFMPFTNSFNLNLFDDFIAFNGDDSSLCYAIQFASKPNRNLFIKKYDELTALYKFSQYS